MSTDWKGVFPAVTTKFKDDFSLDYAGTQKGVNAQIDAGVHGIVTTGSLGESSTLSYEEKQEVLRIAVETADGRVPVLMGVAFNTTAEACRAVEEAQLNGADGFMVLPAMLYPADRRETLAHFRTVADAAGKPIMIYNNPVAYTVDCTVDMLEELADESMFVAIKESSDDVRRITDIVNRPRRPLPVIYRRRQFGYGKPLNGCCWLGGRPCVCFPSGNCRHLQLASGRTHRRST